LCLHCARVERRKQEVAQDGVRQVLHEARADAQDVSVALWLAPSRGSCKYRVPVKFADSVTRTEMGIQFGGMVNS